MVCKSLKIGKSLIEDLIKYLEEIGLTIATDKTKFVRFGEN